MQFEHVINFGGMKFSYERILRGITHGEFLGEASTPVKKQQESDEAYFHRLRSIDRDEVCCIVTDIRWDENDQLIATIRPGGRRADVIERMIADGKTPEFSSRIAAFGDLAVLIAIDLANAPT